VFLNKITLLLPGAWRAIRFNTLSLPVSEMPILTMSPGFYDLTRPIRYEGKILSRISLKEFYYDAPRHIYDGPNSTLSSFCWGEGVKYKYRNRCAIQRVKLRLLICSSHIAMSLPIRIIKAVCFYGDCKLMIMVNSDGCLLFYCRFFKRRLTLFPTDTIPTIAF
jgi:hypothetical protein